MAVGKKREHHKATEPSSAKATEGQGKEAAGEPTPIVVSDTVTETTEKIEVIEEVTPDPLTDFKEKMSEEEKPMSNVSPRKNFMWPILSVVLLALAFLIGVFLYKQGMNKGTQVNVVTLTPTPTVVPKPTKAIDLSKYEIKMLNGSEAEGEAGRQRANLEAEGFTVSSIGNAANSDYTETIIQAKEEVESAYLEKLKSVLEESFVVGEVEELSQDAQSDVIIIIGSQTN